MDTLVCTCVMSRKVQAGCSVCVWRSIATAPSMRLVCSFLSVEIEMYADQTCSKCGDGRVEDLGWCNSCLPWQILVQGECVYSPAYTVVMFQKFQHKS
jgi:hypothetical protein